VIVLISTATIRQYIFTSLAWPAQAMKHCYKLTDEKIERSFCGMPWHICVDGCDWSFLSCIASQKLAEKRQM
jgi:hypothetical protein